MSYEAVYNPLDPAVPNVVTAWNEVDLPTGNPDTINNPNTVQVGGIVTPGACKYDGVSSLIPLTAQEQTRIGLFQGVASQPAPRAIKPYIWQGIIGKQSTTILTGIKNGASVRYISVDDIGIDGFLLGASLVVPSLILDLSKQGTLTAQSNNGTPHEIYLDIIYS